VDRGYAEISIRRQCELLGVNRSGLYYQPVGESEGNLRLMRLLDEQESVTEARTGIERYFRFYNQERLHQSLDYRTPAAIYLARG